MVALQRGLFSVPSMNRHRLFSEVFVLFQNNHRRANSASAAVRTKSLGNSEVRAASAKSACPSDHTFRIQSWLNEKSVRHIQVFVYAFLLYLGSKTKLQAHLALG